MARIAFVMDRIFRKFGLSGKSFIPMLIGTGCGVPGIMASRTIENERDRRMTIMTTTFIPCGAKTAIYRYDRRRYLRWFTLGLQHRLTSSVWQQSSFQVSCLKRQRCSAGDPAPFVMELPAYHLPTVGNVLRSMWERGWSFIKKAGTIILLSTIFVWFTTYFGCVDGQFSMLSRRSDGYTVFLLSIGNGYLHGSLHRLAGATGRQPLHLSQVLLLRRTSLVQWVSFMAAEMFSLPYRSACTSSAVSRFLIPYHSTFSVLLASQQWVLSRER